MKKRLSLIINISIIILEIIGFIITLTKNRRIGIEYYTEESNILILITSTIFIIYLLLNKKIPYYLKLLKYISTICLTVTFLVVILILAPMYNFNYGYLLFRNELLYHHLLCPILSIITFIYFDDIKNYTKLDNLLASLVTLIYGIVLIILNILKIVDGPYPFLQVYKQPAIVSIIWAVTILSITYLIALILRILNNKNNLDFSSN